jgi:hypothetical protein
MESYVRTMKRCKKNYKYNKCNNLCVSKQSTKIHLPLTAPPHILKKSYIRNRTRCKRNYKYNSCFKLCIPTELSTLLQSLIQSLANQSNEPIIDSINELYDMIQDIKHRRQEKYTIKVLYRIKGEYVIPFILTKEFTNVLLTIVNDVNEPCIEINITDTKIELDNYYLYGHSHCPKIYHSDFFVFFKQLMSIFKLPGELIDASYKYAKCGAIPMIVLGLKNGKNFYVRHGWKNENFIKFISDIREMTFEEAFSTYIKGNEANIFKYKPNYDIVPIYNRIMNYLIPRNLLDSTLQEISTYIVEECNKSSGLDSELEDVMEDLSTLFNNATFFSPRFTMD